MRLAVAAALAATALAGPAPAPADPGVRTPADPVYTLTLRGDASATHWSGREQVTFDNPGAAPLTMLYVRLWDNGITGCDSPGIQVGEVDGGTAGPLDAGCTVLPVTLTTPVPPGGSGRLAFDVAINVPARNDRFGRIGREVLVGNAIPLLAIQDGDGWHLDPYTGLGESFYSQVGRFHVTFDTPNAVKVASTGVTVATRKRAGRTVRVVDAPRVRDFAWAAGPLLEHTRRGAHGVRIRVWYPRTFGPGAVDQTAAWAAGAIADYDATLGRYPYGELDVVLARFTGFGGMEYPNLVLSQPFEVAVNHEIAHQWWYGIVGDDEYRDPWLDEAFATWTESRHDGTYGTLCAVAHWPSPLDRVTLGMDFWDEHPREYAQSVYYEGACALQELSDTLGAERFDQLLRRYVAGHRFGWSTTQDFMAAAQQVASTLTPPVDLGPFWAAHRIGAV